MIESWTQKFSELQRVVQGSASTLEHSGTIAVTHSLQKAAMNFVTVSIMDEGHMEDTVAVSFLVDGSQRLLRTANV